MRLQKVKHGIVVFDSSVNQYVPRVGMIVGLSNNCPYESETYRGKVCHVNVLVQWSSGSTTPIHPNNIDIYTGQFD